jgi:hypothetical protein
MNMPFSDECAILGGIRYFWMIAPFLDEYAIFG